MSLEHLQKRLPPEKLHQLLFEDGNSMRGLCDEYGISRTSMTRLYRLYHDMRPDLFPDSSFRRRSLEDRFPIQEAAKVYGHIPLVDLAPLYDASVKSMYNLIAKYRTLRPEWFVKEQSELSFYDVNGKNYQQIREEHGVSNQTILRFRQKYGITRRPAKDYFDYESVKYMIGKGVPLSEIALSLDVGYRRLLQILHEHNVPVSPRPQRAHYRRLTHEEKDSIQRMRGEGRTASQIAKEMDLPAVTIENQFKILGRRRNYVRLRLSKQHLEEQYVILGKSVEEIAKEMNSTPDEVQAHIDRFKLNQY